MVPRKTSLTTLSRTWGHIIIYTGSWKVNQRTGVKPIGVIRHIQGQLVVWQSAKNHVEILELRKKLRTEAVKQVFFEVRFLTIDKQIQLLLQKWLEEKKLFSPKPKSARFAQSVVDRFLSDQEVRELIEFAQLHRGTSVLTSGITLYEGQSGYINFLDSTLAHLPVLDKSGTTEEVVLTDGIRFQAKGRTDGKADWVICDLETSLTEIVQVGVPKRNSDGKTIISSTFPVLEAKKQFEACKVVVARCMVYEGTPIFVW